MEVEELRHLSVREINALAAQSVGLEVARSNPVESQTAVLVRSKDGALTEFDPWNRTSDAMSLAAALQVKIRFYPTYVSDDYCRQELFAEHGGDPVAAACVHLTKRAATVSLNRVRFGPASPRGSASAAGSGN